MPALATICERLKYFVLEGSYIPREYYVFEDRHLVYMPIYKVASTSIKTALIDSENIAASYPEYMEIHQVGTAGRHTLLNPKHWRYFKFAFVRDPFDRLVSCYEDRVRRPIYIPVNRHYFDTDYNHIVIKRLFGECFDQDMSFEDFVSLVCKIPDSLADGHFKSQHAWTHHLHKRIPNYIGKMESFEQNWEWLSSRFNLPAIEHRNPSHRERAVHEYYSSPGLVEAVAHRYRKDIHTFAYEDSYRRLAV